MIPSAKIAKRCRLPPEKRFRKPSTFEPAKFSEMLLDRVDVDAGRRDVGAEPVERQHRGREGELLADLGDPEGVQEGARARELTPRAADAGAARGLDLLARGRREAVRVTVSSLVSSPWPRIFTGTPLRVARPASRSASGRDLGALVEARLEVATGSPAGCACGTSRTASTSSCAGRAACASACESGSGRPRSRPSLRARARAGALVAATRGLADAGALAAADALARVARARGRLQVVQADPAGICQPSSTFTRCATRCDRAAHRRVVGALRGPADPAEAERAQRRAASGSSRWGSAPG